MPFEINLMEFVCVNNVERENWNKISDNVIDMAFGEVDAFYVNNKYQLFKWGNEGIDKIKIPFLWDINGEKILSIKCGNFHKIIKTKNNQFYGYGSNNKHQCLIPGDRFVSKPTKIDTNKIIKKVVKHIKKKR